MQNQSMQNYIIRVGGTALVYTVAIFAAKLLRPGSEAIAVYVVTGVIFSWLILRDFLKAKRQSQAKARK